MSSGSHHNNVTVRSVAKKLNTMVVAGSKEFAHEEVRVLQEAVSVRFGIVFDDFPIGNDDDIKERETLVNVSSQVKDHCYLSLVKLVPSYKYSEIKFFESTLEFFASSLGPEPHGKEVMVNLCIMDMVLTKELPVEALRIDRSFEHGTLKSYREAETHLKTLSKMAESPERYSLTEDGGRMHIEHQGMCSCQGVLCDHGWSAGYILQAIAREGQRLGADIDMSKLFITTEGTNKASLRDSIQQTPLSAYTDKTVDYDRISTQPLRTVNRERNDSMNARAKSEFQPRFDEEMRDSDRLRNQISDDLVTALEGQLNSRTEILENALEVLMQERQMRGKPQNNVAGSSATDESDVESTISPIDSSSSLGRYNRRFMRPGPIYNVGKNSTVLTPVNEEVTHHSEVQFDVVQGFVKTDSMRRIERESVDKVYTINGLACPFRDSRLNFLSHFHTALATCGIDPKFEPIEALEFIGLHKPQNPTEELIKQCIVRTFDFDEMTVIANPFKLPFIEIGMLVSESMLAKCLTMLRSEYRSSWFNEFKCLKVPSFHDEFSQYPTATMSRVSTRTRSKPQRRGVGSGQLSLLCEASLTLCLPHYGP